MAPFDLALRAGEVVGLSGLLGSGRTETAKLVFGALRADSGAVRIDGEKFTPSPRASLSRGVAFCPEDRKAEGIFAELSIRENIVIALQSKRGWLKALSRAEQQRLARRDDRGARHRDPRRGEAGRPALRRQSAKAVLARALVAEPRVLILDEPTRGIDVGAHAEIVALIRRLARDGLALLVASSELEELIAVSHRIAVLRDRRRRRTRRRRHQSSGHHPHDRRAMRPYAPPPARDESRRAIPRLVWPLVALALILAVDGIISPGFFAVRIVEGRLFGSLIDILYRAMPTAIVALGMAVVIGTKGIDLSVGSVIAIAGAAIAWRIHAGDPHIRRWRRRWRSGWCAGSGTASWSPCSTSSRSSRL